MAPLSQSMEFAQRGEKRSNLTPAPKSKNKAVDMFAMSDSSDDDEKNSYSNANGNHPGTDTEKRLETNANQGLDEQDVDDAEGYYLARPGELLDGKYRSRGNVGRGVFSSVLFCDIEEGESTGKTVAIKVIRNNPTMHRAGEKELQILEKVKSVPNIVQVLGSFEHRKHLCLVFERMKMNLRQVLYQYGKNIGINMEGVRTYGKQLFGALNHLKSLGIVHADFKLDNILVSAKLGQVKICDFGSAFYEDDPANAPTPYLVSRFYRAPEIILGLKYDPAVDTWALATCLFELYAGNVMFPGATNNEMLDMIMQCKGRFPNRLLRKHIISYQILHKQPHFDPETFKFRRFQTDVMTNDIIMKLLTVKDSPTKTISSLLMNASNGMSAKSEVRVRQLAQLLEHTLVLDPSKRASPAQALQSPFFNDNM
uniref:Protein kinase domain-containing protein n=1 Tax=Aplanochytrium stocchinoi TaxID=215587 RepID=A0A7S3UYW9_9STRA